MENQSNVLQAGCRSHAATVDLANFILAELCALDYLGTAVLCLEADQLARFATGADSTLPEIGVTGLLILLPLLVAVFDGTHRYSALTPAEREEESVCKKVWKTIRGR
jgi:hypothetical protein